MGARKANRAEKLKAEKKQKAIAVMRDCPTSPRKMRLEEIGYLNGWIGKEQLMTDIEPLKKNQYGQYLMDVMNGKYIDK